MIKTVYNLLKRLQGGKKSWIVKYMKTIKEKVIIIFQHVSNNTFRRKIRKK